MFKKSIDLSWHLPGGAQTVLERTLVAEYLLGKGYLTSDLKELPPQIADRLMSEACLFAVRRLVEFESIERLQIRVPIFLN